jgi:glycosyltransferase involved in cell wall biosynthesis
MTGTPIITIGLPVYNGARHLEEALNALLNQTFSDFEIVISDNCSSDSTEDICRAFASRDSRIRYTRQVRNIGAHANFLFVLEQARTDFFMWAAHDDLFEANWIDRLLPIASKSKCIAFGRVQTVNDAGNNVPHVVNDRDLSFTGSRLLRRLRYATEPGFWGKANPIYGIFPTAAIDHEAIAAFLTNDLEGDVMMMFCLLNRHEIKSIAGTHVFKRQSPMSAVTSSTAPKLRKKMRYRTMIDGFLKHSHGYEHVLLRLLYPFIVIRFRISKLRLKRQIAFLSKTAPISGA